MKETVYFCGIASNVDSSILNLKLKNGFKFKALTHKEGLAFFSSLETGSPRDWAAKLYMNLWCFNIDEEKYYIIENSFKAELDLDEKSLMTNIPSELGTFNQKVRDYLKPTLQLIRLYKEGNIMMPMYYLYWKEANGKIRKFLTMASNEFISRGPFNLEKVETKGLDTFINRNKLPFKRQYISLGFDNFELSYSTSKVNLSFLSLMIAMESLVNIAKDELRFRISRNVAILLGNTKNEAQKIFKDMKDLYDKRSILAHEGTSNISHEDMILLRGYVREVIKKLMKLDKTKRSLTEELDTKGFNDGTF